MQAFNLSTLSNDEIDTFMSKVLELKSFISTCKESVKTNRWKLSFCNATLVIDNYNSTRNNCISNNSKHDLALLSIVKLQAR